MLNALRSLSKSKFGVVLLGLFLAAIAAGFVLADIQNVGVPGSSTGDNAARVGRTSISQADLRQRVQRAYEAARRQDPALTIQTFVAQGGVEAVLNRMIDDLVIEQFARGAGMGVSRKLEDGLIAGAQAFRGLDGRFDQSQYEAFLAREGLNEKQVRADIARDLYSNQLIVPAAGGTRAPLGLALPYASMLLEQRRGQALFVPTAAFAPKAPAEAELTAYYRQNIGRYTIPERRVLRYAVIERAALAVPAPTDAEIAKAYDAAKAEYAPRETRDLSQVILPSESAARDFARKLDGGAAIDAAARAIGLEAARLTGQTRQAYATASAEAVAAAAFQTAQGRIAAPTRSPLGWHVVRVDQIRTVPGKTMADVRGELAAGILKTKSEQAFADLIARIEEAVSNGETFDEVAAANRLTGITTQPLLATGRTADAAPDAPVAPELAAVLKAAFDSEVDDDPVVEQIAANDRAVLLKVGQIVPPTPRPMASIRDRLIADLGRDQGFAAARAAAERVLARLKAGDDLAAAARTAGAALPAPAAIAGQRRELLQAGRPVDPRLDALFGPRAGGARLAPAADMAGWYVVRVDQIVPGDARGQPALIQASRAQFGPVLGQEYAQQLIAAARRELGSEINQAALAALKRDLIGPTVP